MIRICSLLLPLFFLLISIPAQAESVLGLTLPCDNCVLRADPCTLEIDSESFSCESGTLKILKAVQSGPTYSEIRSYFSNQKISKEIAVELLRILESTEVSTVDSSDDDPVNLVENLIKVVNEDLQAKARIMLSQALDKIAFTEYESSRRKVVREESLEALERLAQGDQRLSEILALLLARSAQEALIQAEVERTLWLIDKAKQVYPGELLERDDVLNQLQDHPLLKNRSNLYKSQPKPATRKLTSPPQKILLKKKFKILLLVAGVLWLISISSYYFGFGKSEPKEEKVEVKKADLKKEELLKFFELDDGSTEEDLVRVYRKMAKAVHPDAGEHGMDYDFHKLQDMFEQTRRIVFQIKH